MPPAAACDDDGSGGVVDRLPPLARALRRRDFPVDKVVGVVVLLLLLPLLPPRPPTLAGVTLASSPLGTGCGGLGTVDVDPVALEFDCSGERGAAASAGRCCAFLRDAFDWAADVGDVWDTE